MTMYHLIPDFVIPTLVDGCDMAPKCSKALSRRLGPSVVSLPAHIRVQALHSRPNEGRTDTRIGYRGGAG